MMRTAGSSLHFCEWVDRHRKAVSAVLVASVLAAALLGRSAWPTPNLAHEAIETLGFVLLALCISGRILSTVYIGGRKNGDLVQLGPYSVLRNPLYACSVLGFTGLGLSVGSLGLGLVSGLGFFMLYSVVVRAEEARLTRCFGAAYRAYADKVPRWVPDFRLWRHARSMDVMPGLVQRCVWEGFGMLFLALVIKALEQVQFLGVVPRRLVLP